MTRHSWVYPATMFTAVLAFALAMFTLFFTRDPDTGWPRGVRKFTDGNVTCYTNYDKGISCLEVYDGD